MAARNFIHTITVILLIITYSLQSLSEVEKPTVTDKTREINNSDRNEDSSKPIESVNRTTKIPTNQGSTAETKVESLKASVEEGKVEIKQEEGEKKVEIKQEGGKTKDVNSSKKEDDSKVDEAKQEDEKRDEEKEGEKVEEETGIDLKVLIDSDFEHLTQAATGATTGDWLVLFAKKKECDECSRAEKELKIVYGRMKHKLNVAKVVKGRSTKMTFRRFDLNEKTLPIIYLFHHGKMFLYESNVSVVELIKFLEEDHHLASWSAVRNPYSTFEYYADESVEELKEMLKYKKNVSLIIFLTGFICGICVISLCGSIIFHLLENFKDEDEDFVHEQQTSRDMATGKDKAE